jgi:hypothetical protein
LINQNYTENDLYLPITVAEKKQYEAIDGNLTIREIIDKSGANLESAHLFFKHLWWFDQVVFDIFGG